MRNYLVTIVLVAISLTACVEEDNLVPDCSKWQVEINNPEATVVVQNGRLIIDIPNPQSDRDVRIFQIQPSGVNDPEIAIGVDIANFQWESLKGLSRDTQIKASMAYEANPDNLILESIYGADKSTYRVEGKEIFSRLASHGRLPNEVLFYASGEIAAFERDDRTFPVSLVSVAPKVVALDFGINSSLTRQSPTASIHIELEQVIFEKYTGNKNQIILVTGNNNTNYGLVHDVFDCNSINN